MAWPHHIRVRWHAALLGLALSFQFGWALPARAQEPPLDVPLGGTLGAGAGEAIPIEGWLLYPSIRLYSTYTDNLFNSSQAAISAWGFGESPSLRAEWSNGIHSTTLHASFDQETYPTFNPANRLDWDAGFTQKYEALRDLTFHFTTDIAHATVANALQGSIPTPINAPETKLLPDGNTLLPNGVILSPTGVPVGQTTPALTVNGTSLISPHDQYTGTLSIDKIFNHGILSLNGSLGRTIYEQQSSQDSNSKSLNESAGVWLGPVFYLYSNGSIANTSLSSAAPTTAYTITGGIGTRQIGLFRGTTYFGHQGSSGSGTSHGDIFGASLTYYPTSVWTLSGSFNETTNISSSTSQLALTLPVQVPIQIALSTSARITNSSLSSSYTFSPQWATSESIGYTRIENAGSARPDSAWSASAALSHNMRHNLFLAWQYQFTTFQSGTQGGNNTKQNLFTMSANYNY
jgi:hypothetical protein